MIDGAAPLDVFPAVASRRLAVADLLEGLDAPQLFTPSLCTGWDVRTVGAHLAQAAAPGVVAPVIALLRAGGRPHKANEQSAHRMARRPVPEIAALLRERADSRFTPPVAGPRAPLADLLVHEGDMRLPLQLPYAPAVRDVIIALDFATAGWPVGFVPRGRLGGLRFDATDVDWSWGSGAVVQGRAIDLLLVACGRAAALPHLQGPGSHLLRGRLVNTAR